MRRVCLRMAHTITSPHQFQHSAALANFAGKLSTSARSKRIPFPHDAHRSAMRPLTGEVALVTGASRGLGAAIARALADAGAAVAAVSRDARSLGQVVSAIAAGGGVASAFQADVGEESQVIRAVERIQCGLGPITLLVNNAGILGEVGPFADARADAWWRVMEVNVRGVAACVRAVLPTMMRRGAGRIVNVTSAAATTGFTYFSAYVTSKTAIARLTECVAAEVSPYNVKVFSIEPGTVRTAMSSHSADSQEGRRWIPWFKGIFDQGLDASADRVAQRVLDLACGKGDALSGLHIALSDDLNELVDHVDQIRTEAAHLLRVRRIGASGAASAALAALRAEGVSPSRSVLQLRTTLTIGATQAFRLWTDAAEIARWFLPSTNASWTQPPIASSTSEMPFDWRVTAEGEAFRVFGTYTTVSPASTIVLAWNWESSSPRLGRGRDTRVTVSFREAPGGTEVMVTHEGFESVETRHAHIRGWSRCLTRMRELYGGSASHAPPFR